MQKIYTASERAEIIRTIRKLVEYWFDDERITKKEVTTPQDEFRFEGSFPPGHPQPLILQVAQPRGRLVVVAGAKIIVAPEHVKKFRALDKETMMKFMIDIRRVAFSNDIGFTMETGENMIPRAFIIDDAIYYDNLTQHNFLGALKKIFRVHLLIGTYFAEYLEMNESMQKTKPGDNLGIYR